MDISSWTIRKRNYAIESSKLQMKPSQASSHPLTQTTTKQIVADLSDPLNFLRKEKRPVVVVEEFTPLPKDNPVEYWASLSSLTSKKYASTEGFKIYSDASEEDPKPIPQTFSRLELLEKDNKKKLNEVSYVSHKEFNNHILLLTKEMEQAWNQNDRVKTLKLAIQSTKMLRDVQSQTFYPAVFMTITEMLDAFGQLVYTRLLSIAFEGKNVSEFDPSQVNENSKETSLNWLLKISCIRELQPRLYVEMSLIKNYKFLWDDQHSKVLVRIAQQIRGIGSPVMACYAGMYLCKQVISLGIGDRSFLVNLVEDLCFSLIGIHQEHYDLCIPALSWIFYCTALSSSKEQLFKLIDRLMPVLEYKGDILRIIIEEYPINDVLANVDYFLQLLANMKNRADRMEIAGGLAKVYLNTSIDDNAMRIINKLWLEISEHGNWNIKVYLRASLNFLQLFFKKFGVQQINVLLKDIVGHLREEKLRKDWTSHISEMLTMIIANSRDLNMLLSLEQFLPLLDEVPPQKKTELCNKIIDNYSREEIREAISNPLMIHSLFTITRVVHDSLDTNDPNPELINRVSSLVCKFIRNLNFGRNLEQHLVVLTEARSSFIQFDEVTETLVSSVLDIAMKAHRLVSGKHNFKTHAFLKACISYAHITIPSIDDVKKQFRLYVLTAQIALINNLIGEAEAIVKTAISKIPILAEEEELAQLEDTLSHLIGLMVLLPDNPGKEEDIKYFLLAHGLFNALNSLNKRFEKLKFRLFISMIWYLSSQTQFKLPVKIFRVDSNDKLMSGNERFKSSQIELVSMIIEELLNFVTEVGELKSIDDSSFDILVKFALALEKVFVCESSSQAGIVLNKIISICKKFRGENLCKMLKVVN